MAMTGVSLINAERHRLFVEQSDLSTPDVLYVRAVEALNTADKRALIEAGALLAAAIDRMGVPHD